MLNICVKSPRVLKTFYATVNLRYIQTERGMVNKPSHAANIQSRVAKMIFAKT